MTYLNILLKCMGLQSVFEFKPFPNYRDKNSRKIKKVFNILYNLEGISR